VTRFLALASNHALWPRELDTIDSPPTALWARGRVELLELQPRVALVGTRSPTPYGERVAATLADFLARRGVVVVSGLARGIDACAHRAALEAGGATVAVLGSGVDRPWPADELAERVALEGCLLSEYVPGQAPRRHHFPWRNRLIAGLSRAVVVVEAAQASGSLITARWAADQGRAVFAVPGRIDQPMARGCHRLLKEGAELLDEPSDLLPLLGLAASPAPALAPASEARPEDDLLRALCGETLTADELAVRTGTPTPAVLVRLVELELAGAVVRAPGGLFRLARQP
jgi:DNA processing protein